jgi:hypothetical protein
MSDNIQKSGSEVGPVANGSHNHNEPASNQATNEINSGIFEGNGTATTISAKAVSIRPLSEIEKQQLRKWRCEFRRLWDKETERVNRLLRLEKQDKADILSRAMRLENELGRGLARFDLLWRFNRREIEAVWDDLIRMYPDLNKEEVYIQPPPGSKRPSSLGDLN